MNVSIPNELVTLIEMTKTKIHNDRFTMIHNDDWSDGMMETSEIVDAEIYGKLQRDLSTDPNVNYEILSSLLEMAKLTRIPKRNILLVSTEKKFG